MTPDHIDNLSKKLIIISIMALNVVRPKRTKHFQTKHTQIILQ